LFNFKSACGETFVFKDKLGKLLCKLTNFISEKYHFSAFNILVRDEELSYYDRPHEFWNIPGRPQKIFTFIWKVYLYF